MNIVQHIMSHTLPLANNPTPQHPGNWPNDAVCAVFYTDHDRQFPNVRHEPTVVYFSTMRDYEDWVAQSKAWIKGTDYDFSRRYALWVWDLGPQFQDSFSL